MEYGWLRDRILLGAALLVIGTLVRWALGQ